LDNSDWFLSILFRTIECLSQGQNTRSEFLPLVSSERFDDKTTSKRPLANESSGCGKRPHGSAHLGETRSRWQNRCFDRKMTGSFCVHAWKTLERDTRGIPIQKKRRGHLTDFSDLHSIIPIHSEESSLFLSVSDFLSFPHYKSFPHISYTFFDMIDVTFEEIDWTAGHLSALGGIWHS
jgi:hypothetical protein